MVPSNKHSSLFPMHDTALLWHITHFTEVNIILFTEIILYFWILMKRQEYQWYTPVKLFWATYQSHLVPKKKVTHRSAQKKGPVEKENVSCPNQFSKGIRSNKKAHFSGVKWSTWHGVSLIAHRAVSSYITAIPRCKDMLGALYGNRSPKISKSVS